MHGKSRGEVKIGRAMVLSSEPSPGAAPSVSGSCFFPPILEPWSLSPLGLPPVSCIMRECDTQRTRTELALDLPDDNKYEGREP